MYFLWRKNNNDKTGELIVILTEQDRAQRLISGPQWQCINEPINVFNKDPEVKNLFVTAAYAGDLDDKKIAEQLERMSVAQAKAAIETNKQKVLPNGQTCEEEEPETKQDKDLKTFLSDYDLICPECGERGKALIDQNGNILPCKSCLQIDAYQKGKKEGFEAGCMKLLNQLKLDLNEFNNGENKNEQSNN